jgi:hypothetical protein
VNALFVASVVMIIPVAARCRKRYHGNTIRAGGGDKNSENSKGQQDRNYERSRGIWTNLFGGSKKNSEGNSEK